MISFACRQCGRRFDRPDSAAGSLVFCPCGIGNSVPFESTLPPLPPEPVPAAPASPPPPAAYPAYPDVERTSVPYRSGATRDPGACFNHPETPSDRACTACNEAFCADCTTEIDGQALCGPCKNFRLRMLQRPPTVSVAALLSPLLSVPGLMVSMFIIAVAGGSKSREGVLFWTAATLGVQAIALLLGSSGLRTVEEDRKYSGHSLALTGMASSVVCAVLQVAFGAVMFLAIKSM